MFEQKHLMYSISTTQPPLTLLPTKWRRRTRVFRYFRRVPSLDPCPSICLRTDHLSMGLSGSYQQVDRGRKDGGRSDRSPRVFDGLHVNLPEWGSERWFRRLIVEGNRRRRDQEVDDPTGVTEERTSFPVRSPGRGPGPRYLSRICRRVLQGGAGSVFCGWDLFVLGSRRFYSTPYVLQGETKETET